MRRLVLTCAGACVALVSFASWADTPAASAPPASAPPFAYHALPVAHLANMPAVDKRPSAIAPGAKTDGVSVVHAARSGAETPGMTEVYLVGSATAAKKLAQNMFADDDDSACVMTSGRTTDDDDDNRTWQGISESRNQIIWRSQLPGVPPSEMKRFMAMNPRVQAAHVERLARAADGKSASVDWVDAWVDPVTAGAQTIGKGTMTLTRVATGPAGLEVFAARDEGLVHFVVRTGDLSADSSGMNQMFTRQIQASLPTAGRQAASNCGFLRVTLRAGAQSNEMATFETEAILPPLRPVKAATDDATDVAARMLAARQVRRRVLLVNVSSTQTTADAEPLMSVSFGWDGKDEGD